MIDFPALLFVFTTAISAHEDWLLRKVDERLLYVILGLEFAASAIIRPLYATITLFFGALILFFVLRALANKGKFGVIDAVYMAGAFFTFGKNFLAVLMGTIALGIAFYLLYPLHNGKWKNAPFITIMWGGALFAWLLMISGVV